MNKKQLTGVGLVLFVCIMAIIAASTSAGPGLTVTYNSTIKHARIYIEDARLPIGAAFPNAGSFGGGDASNDSPLSDGATMGGAPDGRDLPDYVDFKWRENPYPDPTPNSPLSQATKVWEARSLATLIAQPIRSQRVFIRSRIPADVVNAAIEANRHTPKNGLPPASIRIYFIWTDYGIKLRWQIWHSPPSEIQYYSDQGGDEIVPAGTTMIASYSNAIKSEKYVVGFADVEPTRHPASAKGTFFPGAPSLAYTPRPISGGEYLAAFESESELPEWVDIRWALFPPAAISPEPGEPDAKFHFRAIAFYSTVPRKNERIIIRSRIPQEVRDEIAAATRNAEPHKVAGSVIYLYFVWTNNGIKLHWRLKRSRPDGTFISVREGGDDISHTNGEAIPST